MVVQSLPNPATNPKSWAWFMSPRSHQTKVNLRGVWESRTERRKPLRKVGCEILDDALWCENEKAIGEGPQFLERDHNSSWMLRVLGKLMSPNDLR
jgi:hypothetical protein